MLKVSKVAKVHMHRMGLWGGGVFPTRVGWGSGQVFREEPLDRMSQAEIDQKYISHRCQLQAPAVDASHRVVPSIPQQTPGTSHPSTSTSTGAPFPQPQGPQDQERGARRSEPQSTEQINQSI